MATSAATDTMFAAYANADTASTANVTFAAGVQDAPIVLAPAIACAVATPRRSSSRVKNVATTHYSKKATVLNCNSAMQASAAIWSSANCDERNHVIDLEHSVVCGNAVEQNRLAERMSPFKLLLKHMAMWSRSQRGNSWRSIPEVLCATPRHNLLTCSVSTRLLANRSTI